MQNSIASLYCPNPHCQAPNAEHNKFCQQCRTLLPKRFLWVVSPTDLGYQVGEAIGDRFLFKGTKVVLDMLPGVPLEMPTQLPPGVEPYLRLFPYRLHVPQVYGLVERQQQSSQPPILLLEQAPIAPGDFPRPPLTPSSLFATNSTPIATALPLEQVWQQATPLRQLHWLWQMAQLWQPLQAQGVATSLLQLPLLRTEGPLLRLLELKPDQEPPTLKQLGQLWCRWVPRTCPAIAPALEQLSQKLIHRELEHPEQLVDQLDAWLSTCGQTYNFQVDLATSTDQGPTRRRNEDACYPPEGTFSRNSPEALTIVCDGVGGHAGGDVASSLAIAVLQQSLIQGQIKTLPSPQLSAALETAIYRANSLISERNDQEKRHDRQRMGTTLVLVLARNHEAYIAHIGDSRAYLITRSGCYQITLDDDVASREVRLGYAFYRQALHQPAAGSLIQALGMGSSVILRPTVQRLILDEDCIFLLCSDGLSDFDRVEEHWKTEILPVLNGEIDLWQATQSLIRLANHQNGHDNVTVSLMHCQVRPSDRMAELTADLFSSLNFARKPPKKEWASDNAPTQQLKFPPQASRSLHFQLWLLLGLSSVLAALLFLGWGQQFRWTIAPDAPPQVGPLQPSPISRAVDPPPPLAVNTFVILQRPLPLRSIPSANAPIQGRLAPNSLLQVQPVPLRSPASGNWVYLRVCSMPLESPSDPESGIQPGEFGWISASEVVHLKPMVEPQLEPPGKCQPTPN